jgi:hypothetical protein
VKNAGVVSSGDRVSESDEKFNSASASNAPLTSVFFDGIVQGTSLRLFAFPIGQGGNLQRFRIFHS